MSTAQIIEELPKLSREDRRRIARTALELDKAWNEAQRDAELVAQAAADATFEYLADFEKNEGSNQAR